MKCKVIVSTIPIVAATPEASNNAQHQLNRVPIFSGNSDSCVAEKTNSIHNPNVAIAIKGKSRGSSRG